MSADFLSEIVEAIKANDLDRAKAALPPGDRLVNTHAPQAGSVVLLATYYGRREILEHLLSGRPELDVFEASATGDRQRVETLVRTSPAVLESYSLDGWTPLHLAAFFGHREVVSLLLDAGAPLEAQSRNSSTNCPIHAASVRGHVEIVRALIDHGANITSIAAGGYTPLLLAAGTGNTDLVKLLLDHGADVSARTSEGLTAPELAAQKGFSELAESLRLRKPQS